VTKMNSESGKGARQAEEPERGATADSPGTRSSSEPDVGVSPHGGRQPEHLRRLSRHSRERMLDERIGDALGWVSIGLGLVALLAPRATCGVAGLANPRLVRAVGVRELVSGAGLLTQKQRAPWLWARVLGDVMDLALIGWATLRLSNPRRGRAAATLAVVGAIGACDLAASRRQSRRDAQGAPVTGAHEAFVEQAITVNRPPQDCYAFWRDLTNLPRFIPALESIKVKDDRTSHWVLRAGGIRLEWDSEIIADDPAQRIGWRSQAGAAVKHAGNIRFESAPGGRGCIVRLLMHYEPPTGRAGLGVATLLGHDLSAESRENLRRFRQLIETGEVASTLGQPSGRRSWLGRLTPEGRKSRPGRILEEKSS
jgi:uncharacterized membrane protein